MNKFKLGHKIIPCIRDHRYMKAHVHENSRLFYAACKDAGKPIPSMVKGESPLEQRDSTLTHAPCLARSLATDTKGAQ